MFYEPEPVRITTYLHQHPILGVFRDKHPTALNSSTFRTYLVKNDRVACLKTRSDNVA